MNVRNRFFGLAGLYLDMFYKRGADVLPFLVNTSASKLVWLSIYKDMPPIPDDEKPDLFKYVIETFPEKTSEERLEAARIIYAIGHSL